MNFSYCSNTKFKIVWEMTPRKRRSFSVKPMKNQVTTLNHIWVCKVKFTREYYWKKIISNSRKFDKTVDSESKEHGNYIYAQTTDVIAAIGKVKQCFKTWMKAKVCPWVKKCKESLEKRNTMRKWPYAKGRKSLTPTITLR